MNEDQLKIFIYSCMVFASNAHFDENRYISKFLKNGLDNDSFLEVVCNDSNIAKNMRFGVCFTMTCWAYRLLYEMGIKDDYYILLDTIEKGSGCINTVLLFRYGDEYRICDLAMQVIHIEKIHRRLFEASSNYEKNEDYIKELVRELSNDRFVNQSLEEYFKNYTGGKVVEASGINDQRIFSEIPQKHLQDFLKEKLGNGRK